MADSHGPDDLHLRVEKLEQEIKELRQALDRIGAMQAGQASELPPAPEQPLPEQPAYTAVPPPPPIARPVTRRSETSAPQPKAPSKFVIPERMQSFDYWLNRIGIALLLFGIAFLFKYSIDQGWITPWLRIVFALVVGGALAGIGFRLHGKRRQFATVLLGGAIGTWYIAGFSAFQLLQLVTHPQAIAFMGLVTLFAFFVSLKQNEPALSLIGTLGGYGTPFLLYTGTANIPGLMAYVSLLIALTGGLFFFKGWKSLLWLTVICGWSVVITGISNHFWSKADLGTPEQWSVQGAIALCWIVFSFVPLIRELTWLKNPERWARSTIGFADKLISEKTRALLDRHLHLLAFSSPVMTYFLTLFIWPVMDDHTRGWIALGLAALYLGVSFWLHRIQPMREVSYSNILVTIFFTTVGLAFLLDGDVLFLAFATEVMALHWIATRLNSLSVRISANVVSLFAAAWLWERLTSNIDTPKPFWGEANLADIWGLICFSSATLALRKRLSGQLFTIGTAVLLWMFLVRQSTGNFELILIGLEAVAVYLIGRISFKIGVYVSSHLFFIAAGSFLMVRYIFPESTNTPLFNLDVLGNLFIIALLILPAVADEHRPIRWLYALAAHLCLLGLFSSELSRLENGQGLVSLAWGAYGIALLLIGLRRNLYAFRLVAMGTLILLVIKLFMIDLAQLETIWRVLLFIGVGGTFLVLSYFFPALWKDQSEPD